VLRDETAGLYLAPSQPALRRTQRRTTMHTISLSAEKFADHDDCLAAAADWYVELHPEAEGWDLAPRWASEDREEILLSVPA
jgi:hypothetical protein